jgi:hypothetical protein
MHSLFFNIHFTTILLSSSWSDKWSLPFRFINKYFVCISRLSAPCYIFRPIIPLDLIAVTMNSTNYETAHYAYFLHVCYCLCRRYFPQRCRLLRHCFPCLWNYYKKIYFSYRWTAVILVLSNCNTVKYRYKNHYYFIHKPNYEFVT